MSGFKSALSMRAASTVVDVRYNVVTNGGGWISRSDESTYEGPGALDVGQSRRMTKDACKSRTCRDPSDDFLDQGQKPMNRSPWEYIRDEARDKEGDETIPP
ncbi:hypothetical protein KM043_011207 [Ampulex compressa]|nr:hypothetical protein KM043_011207 [Ampulex compressa]